IFHVIGGHAMADRYTYVPLIGVFLALVWGLADLGARLRLPARVPALAGSAVLGARLAATWVQVGPWRDAEALSAATLRADPENYMAHFCRGTYLCNRGRLDEGVKELERATELNPDYPLGLYNLGLVRLREGKADSARDLFARAAARAPRAGRYPNGLGLALLSRGRFDEACQHFEQAVRLEPEVGRYHNDLGLAL